MALRDMPDHDDRPEVVSLFANLKAALPHLQALLDKYNDDWEYEDRVYRFYHLSSKVYDLQAGTTSITEALQALAPDRKLHEWYRKIVSQGTGKKFVLDHNDRWLKETRPIVEAFFHARYGGQVRDGVERPPNRLPSGWAAFLYLRPPVARALPAICPSDPIRTC
jgi:hypothetical protein